MWTLIDEKGAIREKMVLSGDEPFRSAAIADSSKLTLPKFVWPGYALRSVRTITFEYTPEKTVVVRSRFGEQNTSSSDLDPPIAPITDPP
jgi:hypothetical protein